MKKAISFDIKNNQQEYADCLQFMQYYNLSKSVKLSNHIPVEYMEYDIEGDSYKIACELEEKFTLKQFSNNIKENDSILWYFRIHIDQEDDIVNLMHYYLIRQRYENVLAVLITPDLEYDMKISAYLSFEIKKDRNTIFIKTPFDEIETYGSVHRLPGASLRERKDVRLTKFLPLIEVTNDTYDFLSGTVEAAQKKIHKRETDADSLWEKTVMNTCAGLFTQYNRVTSEKYINSKEFRNTVSNVTVLAYILFCAFRNHCEDRRKVFEILKIEQELSDARDIAEGILQILENTVLHSQNKAGYFSFRIHDSKKSTYLKRTYAEYIKENRSPSNDIFLEMFMADCFLGNMEVGNESILCKQFVNNLLERSIYDKAIEPFIHEYKDLEVKDFFDNVIWKKYNAVSDNIIEHYGLQLFDKIVNSCNGCFEVISTTDFRYQDQQCYYSVKRDKERYGHVIPGTQYKVLLPISERNSEQEYAGMDFCDYSKTAMLKPVIEEINLDNVDFSKRIKEINGEVQNKLQKNKNEKKQKKLLKATLIQEISKAIYDELDNKRYNSKNYVIHFILDGIKGAGLVEIFFKAFMKALIKFRSFIGNKEKVYFAFGKLTKEFITEFCYLIGIYYYKAEESKIMMNTEMYFWSTEYYEDLLVTGENLHIAHNVVMERSVLRGIYPHWLNFIDYVWKKYDYYNNSDKEERLLDTLPYDVIVKDEEKTIFENIVEKVLQRPMANRELGCLIDNTHIQLSSKVHVTRFYNGHVLFMNNYFTNYFSYLIVNEIIGYFQENKDFIRNIAIVGYESYSEMLLVETTELLKSYIEEKKLSSSYRVLPYIIGELTDKKLVFRSAEGCFDQENTLNWQLYKDSQFIFIVPISSTLSIFEKILFGLEKNLGIVIKKNNIIASYALIVSRDIYKEKIEEQKDDDINIDCYMTPIEGEYWKEKKGHRILTKNRKIYVDYFIEVCGKWAKASKCEYCFPAKSICEKPLIKTDITGLAPLAQLGQKRKWKKGNSISNENIKRIKSLSDVLTYNHIERGGNHYLYYFDTATFFYNNRNQISEWLKSIPMNEGDNKRQYSFIVSPLHGTNAGFTEEVNKVLFHNTAHIIRLDFCKTYRSNFMQQFSYLQILYQNIVQSSLRDSWKTEINFYFVDDEVLSGKTLIRAKSLIEGLFDGFIKVDDITVNSFKKIFVLVNRLSDASKHNYIENIDDYKSYVNYNVSTIQNHDDFCFMCKLVDRAKGYKYMSATNEMDAEWGNIQNKFKVKDYTWAEQNKEYRQDKYKSRMLAAHYSEAAMWNLSENAVPEEYFHVMLKKLFYDRLYKRNGEIALSKNNREVFISLIKTLSRPFFVYRNNAKEAALHLLIAFSESFLGQCYNDLERELDSVISVEQLDIRKEMQSIWQFLYDWGRCMDDSTYNLLLDLLEQLADMESGYIIRRDNVIRVFQFYNMIADNKFGKDEILEKEELEKKRAAQKEFELSYALFIKQLTNEDADETKSLWVEKLFYFGQELNSEEGGEDCLFHNYCGYQTAFGSNILVENTKIIYDGIKFLAESISREQWNVYEKWILKPESVSENVEEKIKQTIGKEAEQVFNTQLESFKYVLQYYGQADYYEKIGSEALLYGLMFYVNTEGIPFEHFYKKFYSLIREITKAEVQILMIPGKSDMDELFYPDEACIIYDCRTELNLCREIKLKDQPLVESSYLREIPYELDTYYINRAKDQAIIKYSINSKNKDEKDSIYLILRYGTSQEKRQLLFDIRLVLLCRSRTITRMKRDFNNNLFQSLWQTKMHNMLLEHFKNAAHNDPEESDVMRKNIRYISWIEQYCRKKEINPDVENGLRIYKALLLKMLADNNISSIYHEILAQRLVSNDVCPTDFSVKGIFSDIEDIRYVLVKVKEDYNEWIKKKDALPVITIDQEVLDSKMYYIAPDPFRPHLLVISLILNAYKHGNNEKEIKVYRQIGTYVGENKIDYLCIANGICPEQAELIKNRIEEHINKPVTSRKTQGEGEKCDGITLFSLNRYCQKILEGLGKKEYKDNLVEYIINNDRIVFRVPILKGEC